MLLTVAELPEYLRTAGKLLADLNGRRWWSTWRPGRRLAI